MEPDTELGLAWFQNFLGDILQGEPYRTEVKAIETDMAENYKPCLNALIRVFEGIVPEMTALLEELKVALGKLQEALSRNLKRFEDCETRQEKGVAFLNLKVIIVEPHEFMKDFDHMYEKIWTDFGPSDGPSQDPECVVDKSKVIPCD